MNDRPATHRMAHLLEVFSLGEKNAEIQKLKTLLRRSLKAMEQEFDPANPLLNELRTALESP